MRSVLSASVPIGLVAVVLVVAAALANEPAADPAAAAEPGQPRPGTVAGVYLDDRDREENLRRRLHFCVFDDGANDSVYVGTNSGMWSGGSFDLEVDGKVVFTGKVPHLVYEGVVLPMGDVLDGPPKSNARVRVTRVAGTFK